MAIDWRPHFPFPDFRPRQQETLDEIVEAFERYKYVILQAPCGCHAANTPILMYDGSIKAVENIVIGDVLVGPGSTPRTVLRLHRGREGMARIIPTKGEPFVVNMGHILSLQKYGMKTDWWKRRSDWQGDNTVTNISVKDYLAKSHNFKWTRKLYRAPITHWKECALPIPPYILGCWLGDGTSNQPTLTGLDEEVLQEWETYGASLGLQAKRHTNYTGCPHVSLTYGRTGRTNPLIQLLKSLGVWANKHVPQQYLTSSTEQRLELLAGLLDTDGSLCSNGFDFIAKEKRIADAVVFLARSVGLAAYQKSAKKWCVTDGKRGEPAEYHRVSISGDTHLVPCRIPRKKATVRQQQKSVLRTAFNVEILPEDDYYGFEVDGDHLYLMGDFTVTHNSGKSSYALALASYYKRAYIATVQKQLQDQYQRDYGEALAILKGKSNYECTANWQKLVGKKILHSCETAPCGVNIKTEAAKSISAACVEEQGCPYLGARFHGLETASVTLLNFSIMLSMPHFIMKKRPLVIIDEGHKLESELYSFADLNINKHTLAALFKGRGHLKLTDDDIHFDNDTTVEGAEEIAGNVLEVCEEYLDSFTEVELKLDIEACKSFKKIEGLVAKLDFFLEDRKKGGEWTVRKREPGKITPTKVNHLKELAFKAGDKVLLMSGTVLEPNKFAENLGIEPGEFHYIELPYQFPVENRPVIVYPVGSMAFKSRDQTWPKMMDMVRKITNLPRHRNEKGVIHTHSFKNAEDLAVMFEGDRRFLIHTRIENKNGLIQTHLLSEEPTILVGPSFKEGLDLKEDLARWQIIVKVPYADTKDEVVAKRMETEPDWYALLTAMDIVQMLGRPVRSQEDKAVTYILDEGFLAFFRRWKKLFPQDVIESLVFQEKKRA